MAELVNRALGRLCEPYRVNLSSYQLEEIIKGAEERLVMISLFLRINESIKSLFEDRGRKAGAAGWLSGDALCHAPDSG